MILAQQENLDREIRVGQQRRESNELVEHVDRRRTLWRPTHRRNLAVLVDAHDPTFSRDRVHDTDTMLVKQRIELPAQGREAARLHLDQLAISTNQVDHEPADRHLKPVTRLRQHRFDRTMQRPFALHPDARHGTQARRARGIRPA